jgi:hypothetical protein
MICPWYRSRLFWLGIPGLVFMLWLWLAKARESFSFRHTGITGPRESTSRSIGTSDGLIYQATVRSSFGVSGPHEIGFHGSLEALESERPTCYLPLRPFGIIRENEYREIWLAWWAVIPAYTVVWLGAVACWQRRKSRLSRRAAAELPGS